MDFYYVSNNDLISLQLLIVLSLANIFIMFFIFFSHINNNFQIRRPIEISTTNDNVLGLYEIRYNDILTCTYSDDFPYEDTCSICLIDFELGNDSVIKTRSCNHYFHEECIKQWLIIKTTCPNCQNNLVSRYIEDVF